MGRRVEALSTGRVCRASPVCNRATSGYAISVGSVRVSYPLAVGRPGRFNLRPIPGCMSPQPHSVTLDPGEPRSRCISLQGVPFEPCPVVVWMRRVCGMTAAPVPSRPCQLSGALARPSRSSPPRVAIWPPNVPSVVWPSRGRRGAHREASGSSCRRVWIHASPRIAGIVVWLSRDPERNLQARDRTAGSVKQCSEAMCEPSPRMLEPREGSERQALGCLPRRRTVGAEAFAFVSSG